jgi:hypothetical protein
MLQDAGLEVHERNLVMTALKNDFSFERVAQELRNQWPEHELKTNHHGTAKLGFQTMTRGVLSLSLSLMANLY